MTAIEQEATTAICQTFIKSEASYDLIEHDNKTASLLYWIAALRMVERKPFADDIVQAEVLVFLNEKLDQTAERLLAGATKRLKETIQSLDI